MNELIPDLNKTGEQSVITGSLLELANSIDRCVLNLAQEFRPEEFMFPSFIDIIDLKKMDYLHSFPQHATFVTTLDDDESNLHKFRDQGIFNNEDAIALTKTTPIKKLLTPATCYHCYINQANKIFKAPFYMTAKCTCYRREKYYVPFERQWNFTMREIVCLGSYEETIAFTNKMMSELDRLIENIGLNARWQNTEDMFFDPSSNPKALMQKIQPSKFELVFDERLAIGSINIHRNYFGQAFNIKRGEEFSSTACAAFGIERWLSALTSQFGHNKMDWPNLHIEEMSTNA